MNSLRTGVLDPALHLQFGPPFFLQATRQVAAAGGADSIWLPDHLNSAFPSSIWNPRYCGVARLGPRADAIYEPWTALGHIAAKNRRTRLRLGVGVTDAGRRNPAVTAQAAATLHLLSRGRAILGIGTGEREGNQPYGVDWTRPVARFEEALATIRALWDSDGELVTRDSQYFPLRDAVFGLPPYKGSRPAIWVAAHGPRMLRATGTYADGWLPFSPQSPAQYGEKLAMVRSAASDAGRDPSSITPAALFFVLTASSRTQVDELTGSTAAKAFTLGSPADVWAQHGVEHPMGPTFSGIQDLLPQTLDEATVLSYVERVPESLVRTSCLAGTPSEILAQLDEWRDHGLRYVVLANLSPVHPRLRTGFGSTRPLVRLLRGIRRL
ncbi:LLM class flavin-dependent oxidoreductase [Nocardia higoensis]|uniref:LLM class flavin-dependent oxidoreductase n=1 Tax=Nocardia higoensis TaxID=228599 RepID=UPI00030CD868|nr:LLM class flavin-dependent oxidoreductase [Nocardia higoensis]